jgi:hypothetical protein
LKVIAVIGQPAAGKSTLVKAVINHLGTRRLMREGSLTFEHYELDDGNWVNVLGYYQPDDPFGGTDKLSMSIQPQALVVLKSWAKYATAGQPPGMVLFEGDRLGNLSFLTALAKDPNIQLHVVFVEASEASLKARQAKRGNKQTPAWLKGRASKYQTLRGTDWEALGVSAYCSTMEGTTLADQAVANLLRLVKGSDVARKNVRKKRSTAAKKH